MFVATNALYWKFFKRQNSTHLTLLKHLNTKTSLYKLSKNHRVFTLLGIFGSDRRNLQSTVSLDHPVETETWFKKSGKGGEVLQLQTKSAL